MGHRLVNGSLRIGKVEIDSGTLCRSASPVPGPTGFTTKLDPDLGQLKRRYPELWESILRGDSDTVISRNRTAQLLAMAEGPRSFNEKKDLMWGNRDYARGVELLKGHYLDMCREEYAAIDDSLKGLFRSMAKEKKFSDEHEYYAWLRTFYYRWGVRNPALELNDNIIKGKFLSQDYLAHKRLVEAMKEVEEELGVSDPDLHKIKINGAFVPRPIGNNQAISQHALGRAIDFDPETNPQLSGELAKVLDEILTFLKTPWRIRTQPAKISIMPEIAIEEIYSKMKNMSETLQAFLGTWLAKWEQLSDKKKLYEKIVTDLERKKKADPIDVDRGRQEKYELSQELGGEEYKLVGKLVNVGGRETARRIRDKGIITLDLRLVKAMTKARVKWGAEWNEQKDTMHFEIPLPKGSM